MIVGMPDAVDYAFPDDLLQAQRAWYATRLQLHKLYARLPQYTIDWVKEDAVRVEELLERERQLAEQIGTSDVWGNWSGADLHHARMALKAQGKPDGWAL